MIEDYCREPGVRTLEKYTRKILEKIAFQYVRTPGMGTLTVDIPTLRKFVGQPRFSQSRFYERTPIVISISMNNHSML